jgi:hypothetical protein
MEQAMKIISNANRADAAKHKRLVNNNENARARCHIE